MSDELKQFVALTSGTSSGFAKVMSTHWMNYQIRVLLKLDWVFLKDLR